MGTAETFFSTRAFHPQFTINNLHTTSSRSIKFPIQKPSKDYIFTTTKPTRKRLVFPHQTYAILGKLGSGQSANPNGSIQEDFVTRVLQENPSEVEPRYLIGDKLYTLKEKEDLLNKKRSFDVIRALGILKRLNSKGLKDEKNDESGVDKGNDQVYLKDLLREFKRKLYVPEQIL